MEKTLVFCLLLALMLTGCKEEKIVSVPIRPVRVFTVETANARASRTFPGKVKATRDASLAFRVAGQIVKLGVKEGDFVKQGQLIAMLDQRDFQAAVADLEARLVGSKSVLKEAKLNIERNKTLLKERIIAQSAFDAAQSTYETSRSEVLSLEQSLRRARLNLQYTRLEAPFDGIIAEKIPSNHEYVQAKEIIVKLIDTTALDVVIDIPENVWVKAFRTGETDLTGFMARFESVPGKQFPVRIKEYQTNANPQTQTYKVTLTMDNAQGLGIQPGMTAEIIGNVPDSDNSKSVTIPFSSVVGEVDGPKYVWVLNDDNLAEKREIRIENLIQDKFRVAGGIKPGDVLIVAGVNYLREGQQVKILEGRIGGRD
ncbi:efflux RND transporter periplasmic adaptor subunit [Pseudodesulfovibrio sp. JC047]|uniref:efflux RND transporter periplasmic adaptor subunit n=1 Tax=Pseudodesulfovibrio sp. JC047 TaxID=2683199 RepID=UPI0013D11E2C|nr:efflux RND transporter periplasmic adaptor subunit [Pseudodesulfovibrio sp. JC047]NDV19894.1 efflux RND transporter periplasmic adaptor subunit [Pseudodesulfovibrio sp. JC047]